MKQLSEWTRKELDDKMQKTLTRFQKHREKGDRLTEDEIELDRRIKQEWKRREELEKKQ